MLISSKPNVRGDSPIINMAVVVLTSACHESFECYEMFSEMKYVADGTLSVA